jgi:uncharacterized membrane protein
MKRLYVEYYVLILVLVFGFTWFVYPQLPDVMVTHWGFEGQANGWMEKAMGAWIVPVLLMFLWGVWEVSLDTINRPYRLMGLFLLLFLGVLQVMVLGINLGWHIDMLKGFSWLFVVFTAVLGQLLPVIPRNPIVGIRTPWSMKSDAVWLKTHQETGKWCRGVSLIDIIVLLVLSPSSGFLVVISGFMGCLLLGLLFSYIYRRR